MKRVRIIICIVVALAGSVCPSLAQDPVLDKWEWAPGNCPGGSHRQPNGPFAVALFCEDALGTYLSVIYIGPIGAPATQNGRWTLADRYWHDPLWGSDVTWFKWSQDGTHLFISTSEIYGSGGFFELDVLKRTATQHCPRAKLFLSTSPVQATIFLGLSFNDLNSKWLNEAFNFTSNRMNASGTLKVCARDCSQVNLL